MFAKILRHALIAVFLGVLAGSASASQSPLTSPASPEPAPSDSFQKLQVWLAAIEQHQPGLDNALLPVATWSRIELVDLLSDLNKLKTYLPTPSRASNFLGVKPRQSEIVRFEGQVLTKQQVQQLLGLSDDEAARRDLNRILKRAALLHTDIALNPLALGTVSQLNAAASAGQTRMLLRTEDGRMGGFEFAAAQWEIARLLLDAVTPTPSRDEMVRLWYRATAAYLHRQRSFGEAVPHLTRARALFPDDAPLLFYSGVLQETFAGPGTQSVVQTVDLPPGYSLDISSARVHLSRAEGFLRQALKSDPNLVEARVHLGHVVAALGRHVEAAAELRRAVPVIADPSLLYYAEMFLGRAEEELGHDAAARICFERALKLFPRAQSPQLALAQLAWQENDHPAALQAIAPLFTLPSVEQGREDPWWSYEVAHVRNADALLDEVRRPFLAATEK